MQELSRALGSSVASVAWAGPDRDGFDASARAASAQLAVSAARLVAYSTALDSEAEQQDLVSEPTARNGDSGSLGNGGQDQRDPKELSDMADPEPYAKTEEQAEENIGSRGMDQGTVSDCWYLAALMGIAERDPEYIREHMWKNEDGTWTVKMYKDGEPVEIIVESDFSAGAANHRIPLRDENGEVMLDADGEPIVQSVSGGWPAIFEKAAVEYRSRYGDPDYEHIEWGWADEGYEMLTPHGAERTGEANFDEIQERLAKGPVSVASEHPEDATLYRFWEGKVDNSTIVPRHEYNVAGFVPAGEEAPDGSISTEDRVHLENPWGPEGGGYGGTERAGDVYLTEGEYKENFRGVSSVEMEG